MAQSHTRGAPHDRGAPFAVEPTAMTAAATAGKRRAPAPARERRGGGRFLEPDQTPAGSGDLSSSPTELSPDAAGSDSFFSDSRFAAFFFARRSLRSSIIA